MWVVALGRLRPDVVPHAHIHTTTARSRSHQIALYGLGNVRDDRFIRLVNDNNVKFRRPAPPPRDGAGAGDDDDEEGHTGGSADDFFSIFMIYQNR